jgi:hypothetical protein
MSNPNTVDMAEASCWTEDSPQSVTTVDRPAGQTPSHLNAATVSNTDWSDDDDVVAPDASNVEFNSAMAALVAASKGAEHASAPDEFVEALDMPYVVRHPCVCAAHTLVPLMHSPLCVSAADPPLIPASPPVHKGGAHARFLAFFLLHNRLYDTRNSHTNTHTHPHHYQVRANGCRSRISRVWFHNDGTLCSPQRCRDVFYCAW